jgi:D-lactate dehydrogenase (cytochrome)/glycolate oxidase
VSSGVHAQLLRELKERFPTDQVIVDDASLVAYSYDATGERHRPDAVVFPSSSVDVVDAVKIASRYHVPIIARGAGSNLSGGTLALAGGLVIVLSRMRKILNISIQDGWVDVEPGVVNADLQDALRPFGYFYPPDPSSHRISTLGGNVAENSGGPHCVKYGVTSSYVLSVTMVLANAHMVTLGSHSGRSNYDLRGVVVGSEGTLGVVTAVRLRIRPLPESTRTMVVAFHRLVEALACASQIIASHVDPSALELLDQPSLQVIEPFVRVGFPVDAGGLLLVEVDGDAAKVSADIHRIERLVQLFNPVQWRVAQTLDEAELLWRGRRAHYGALAKMAPRVWVQDITVPRPALAPMMAEVLEIGHRYGIQVLTAAHAGDGNLHPTIAYDPESADSVHRMKLADADILAACVGRGGSITGEHGVGIDKLNRLPLMDMGSCSHARFSNEVVVIGALPPSANMKSDFRFGATPLL